MKAYVEIIEFLAAGTSPYTIANFQPSQPAKQRVTELLQKEKLNTITSEEQSELSHFLEMEHLMRMAKARARQYLHHP